MSNDDQIKDKKLQSNINREAAKISAFSSGKIDKYEDLTYEEILPSNQKQIVEQAKLLKNKQKQLTIKDKNKKRQLKIIKNN